MSTKLQERPPMPAERDRPQYVTTKILASIHRKAKVVAAYRETTVAEYLSELLEKLVDADHQKMRRAMDADDKRREDAR